MKKALLVILIILSVLSLIACCGNYKRAGSTAEQPPEVAVKMAFDALKTNDSKKASEYMDHDNYFTSENFTKKAGATSKGIDKLFFSKLQYKILSSKINDNEAYVKTQITNVDMLKVLTTYLSDIIKTSAANNGKKITDDQSTKVFQNIMKRENNAITKTVDVKLDKINNRWRVNLDNHLMEALMGGNLESDINNVVSNELSKLFSN